MLGVGRFRETDMWVRLLTKGHGVVRAFAFGASKSRRRFSGCLDLLNILRVRATVSGNGKFLNLEEGVLLQGPRRLRTDMSRLGMAVNCVRFLEAMDVPPDFGQGMGNELQVANTAGAEVMSGAFELMRSLCTRLEAEEGVSDVLPALFRLRLASDQGFAPSFSQCSGCGRELAGQGGFFSVAEGALVCTQCAPSGRNGVHGVYVSGAALDSLATVQATLPETWTPECLTPQERRECARLVDAFVQYHLGLTWDRGRFRRL